MKGFSLIEAVIVGALFLILVVVILPSYRGFGSSNDLTIVSNTVAQALNEAQALARAGERDSDWGVRVVQGRVTIFLGDNFLSRDQSADRFFIVPQTVVPSGLLEAIFSKFSGLPQQTGDFILTNDLNQSRVININSKGTLSF